MGLGTYCFKDLTAEYDLFYCVILASLAWLGSGQAETGPRGLVVEQVTQVSRYNNSNSVLCIVYCV